MAQDIRFCAAILWVRDLRRSEEFYRELLRLEVLVRDVDVVGLVTPEGQQLFLRARRLAPRVIGDLGVHFLVWAARDLEDLSRCEKVLGGRGALTGTTVTDDNTVVEGVDPDENPIMVMFPGCDEVPIRAVPSRVYASY